MKKSKLQIPVKQISLTVMILLVLTVILGYTWKTLTTSDYFKIREVITKEAGAAHLSYLKGRNIFSVDLNRESRYILAYFPECRNVRLVRILPNRLFVDLLKRKPAALVKLYKYFSVDEDGVFFDPPAVPEESGLPVITGLETKIFGPKNGKKYSVKELNFALSIISEAKRNKVLGDYRIRRIDCPNTTHASFFIIPGPGDSDYMDSTLRYEGMEVKLSAERVRFKMALLANLMAAAKREWNNIKYIDLRFKEPVIKLKDAK